MSEDQDNNFDLDTVVEEIVGEEADDPRTIGQMIDDLPEELRPDDIEEHLGRVLGRIADQGRLAQEQYLRQLKQKTKLGLGTLRAALKARRGRMFRGGVDEGKLGYIDVESGQGISTFLLVPQRRVRHDDGQEMIEATIHNPFLDKSDTIVLPASALQSRSAFFKRLKTLDFQFAGSDENLQAIAQQISERSVQIVRGTSNIGYYEVDRDPRWIAPGIIISRRGVNVDKDIVCVEYHASIGDKLEYPVVSDPEVAEVARQALPLLVNLNAPGVVMLVLAWFVASVFKVQLHRQLGHFPILCVAGSQGSGKTSTLEQVGRLVGFGQEKNKPFSVAGTRFVLIRLLSSTSSVPVFLDEYKPTELEPRQLARVHHLLRQAYGGEVEERGRADLSVDQFVLRAPVVIAGEAEVLDDPALRERLVLVRPNKQALQGNPGWRRSFAALTSTKLEVLAVPLITFSLGQDVAAQLAKARTLLALAGPRIEALPLRQRDNLLVEVFGLMMLRDFALSLGVAVKLDVATMVETYLAQVLDGARGAKDAFDDFLAECATHARDGALIDGVHYAYVDGMLRIHLPSCHQVYLEKRARTHRRDATNGLNALRRIVHEKIERGEYVTSAEERVALVGGYVRAVEIDPSKIPEHLHIDPFPKHNDRRHGGARDDGNQRTGSLGSQEAAAFSPAVGCETEPDFTS